VEDVLMGDFILIPVNEDFHWYLVIVDVLQQRFAVLDGLGGRQQPGVSTITNYFKSYKKLVCFFLILQ